jgi:hypothetical protein
LRELKLFGVKLPFGGGSEGSPKSEANSSFREDNAWEQAGWAYGTVFGEGWDPPYDIKSIQRFASNPQAHNCELRKLAWWAYHANGTVSSAIDALKSIYTLDSVVVCRGKGGSPARKAKSKAMMESALEAIRYKQVIRDAIFKSANDGMYIGYFDVRRNAPHKRETLSDLDVSGIAEACGANAELNATVTPLPIDYVRIVGRRNNSYVVAFDLRFFQCMREDERDRALKAYPAEIRDAWGKYGDGRGGESWVVLDNEKTIAIKIKSGVSDPYGIPFSVAALDDIDYAKYFVDSKRKLLDSVNNQVIYEVFPEGQAKGSSSLSGTQQKQQHDTVKSALFNKKNRHGISFFSLASGTKLDKVKVDVDLLDEKNENGIKDAVNKGLGVSATALDGSSSGNFAATTLNLEVVASHVYSWIEEIALELNKCINANILKDPSCRSELYILPTTFVNRSSQVGYMKELYESGKGSLTAWIASTGFRADVYLALMDYEREEDFENAYPVHKTSYNMQSGDDPGGRPEKPGSAVPSTVSTKANNSNGAPKPSTG